ADEDGRGQPGGPSPDDRDVDFGAVRICIQRPGHEPLAGRHPSTSMDAWLPTALGDWPPTPDGDPAEIPTPPIRTPPGLNWPRFMMPVIWIIDPSCALISAISIFGPFMRMCVPSGTSALPGSSSVR